MKIMKNSKTAGISLVALVVTIIVLIILTGAVIVTFMDGGIIDRAKESVFKNDIRTYQEQLVILKAKDQINVLADKEPSEITGELTDIQSKIPEFKKEYEGLVKIKDGEIVLGERAIKKETEEDEKYATWLEELGIGEGTVNEWDNSHAVALTITDEGVVTGFALDTRENKGTEIFYISEEYSDLIIPSEKVNEEGETIKVTTIGKSAFAKCEGFKSVILPDTITTIEDNAFFYSDIETIEIPEGVISIGDSVFYNNRDLVNIKLPSTITSIGVDCFAGTEIESMELPNGITNIGSCLFQNCYNLKAVTISGKLEKIEDYAFWGCIYLSDIYYGGTEERWNQIDKGEDWDYNVGVGTEEETYRIHFLNE